MIILIVLLTITAVAHGKQTQPDAKRIAQIRVALIEHGYQVEDSWSSVQETLRGIARDRGWQTCHAPDARVLILLGLGNKYSDPDVIDWPVSQIEKGYIEEVCQKKEHSQ